MDSFIFWIAGKQVERKLNVRAKYPNLTNRRSQVVLPKRCPLHDLITCSAILLSEYDLRSFPLLAEAKQLMFAPTFCDLTEQEKRYFYLKPELPSTQPRQIKE